VVLEGCDVLAPSGQVATHLHLNEFSQPSHVLDLLLLELQVSKEATDVESTFESHGVATGCLLQHNVIDGSFITISLVTVVHSNSTQDLLIGSAFNSKDEGTDISHVVELLEVLGVEVSNLGDVLAAFHVTATLVRHTTNHQTVGDNLDSLTVSLELKQVAHDERRGLLKVDLAEVVEFVEPDFADTKLDLLKTVIFHSISNELGIDLSIFVRVGTFSDFVKEFAEVDTNGKID
jgi:hypothetical protein